MDWEITTRLFFFFGIFAIMAYWERKRPRRPLHHSTTGRWINNLGLVVINSVTLKLVFPIAAVGLALHAEQQGWGLLNIYSLPAPLAILLAVIALDFCIYLQHVLFHSVPLLWRLHMVHHADLDYDLTTGLRFHPIEIILSMLIKFAAILVIGPSALAVIMFEIILNACAMFNHSNVKLPRIVDQSLRLILVTPDMHRVHHSTIKQETNSNYGFSLSIWDRLFGTYRPQPSLGHDNMQIGLEQFRDPNKLNLAWLLALPFIGKLGRYPINRDQN